METEERARPGEKAVDTHPVPYVPAVQVKHASMAEWAPEIRPEYQMRHATASDIHQRYC